jgi:outer membrane protein assembly factor BamA
MHAPMKLVLIPALAAVTVFGQSVTHASESQDRERTADLNVNSKYTIESISFLGQREYKLSTSASEEIHRLVGARVNTEVLDQLAQHLRGDLDAHAVTFKLTRGERPDSVKVLIQVDKAAGSVEASVPKFGYNSELGWTGIGELRASLGSNNITVRMLRDSDNLIERFSGMQAKYERVSSARAHVRLGFEFEAYQDEYDALTSAALENSRPSSLGAGAYGSRLNFEPSATFVLTPAFTLSVGLGFEQLHPQSSAARSESANAVINTLRYHQRWNAPGDSTQELDAGYTLRAATKLLGTDLAYTQHITRVRYNYSHNAQSVEVTVVAGAIYGQAPLFERFALGDSAMLRGWNKYDLDPLGGNRLAYGSVTYGYHIMRVFYDTGSVWDQGKSPEAKQSAGIGVSSGLGVFEKGAFLLAVAFPLRQGHVTPVLIAGMNF